MGNLTARAAFCALPLTIAVICEEQEMSLDFYTIDTDYVNYLKKFEKHMWDNKEKGRIRPYAGVVLTIGEHKYYAPLTSPKPKHEKMKGRIDFVRLEYNKKLTAVLNLNNMIPVVDSLVTPIRIKSVVDKNYRHLLNAELVDLKRKQGLILKNAKAVYTETTVRRNEPYNKKLVSLSFDFLLLEQKLKEYLKQD